MSLVNNFHKVFQRNFVGILFLEYAKNSVVYSFFARLNFAFFRFSDGHPSLAWLNSKINEFPSKN